MKDLIPAEAGNAVAEAFGSGLPSWAVVLLAALVVVLLLAAVILLPAVVIGAAVGVLAASLLGRARRSVHLKRPGALHWRRV